MWKTLFIGLVCTIAFAIAAVDISSPHQYKTMILNCKKKTKAPDVAVKKYLLNGDPDSSPEGKCFLWCVSEAIGTLKADGTPDNELVEEIFEQMYRDSTLAMDKWRSCQNKVKKGDDLCHYTYDINKCFFEEIKQVAEIILETRNRFFMTIEKCFEKTNATATAVNQYLAMKSPDDTPAGKHFLHCALETFGLLKIDGTPDNDVVKKFFGLVFNDRTKPMEFWTSCLNSVTKVEDKCEYSYSIVKCFHGKLEENGISPKEN